MSVPQAIHIAAAQSLVKARPKHLSIQEYIQALRQSVRTKHCNGQIVRQIDHSAFWQGQYDILYTTLEQERNAAFVLKQQNEALEAQVADLQARSQSATRKRKPLAQPEPDTTKRLKADSISAAEFGSAADVEPTIKAMRHIHRVQTLCKGGMYSTKASELAYHLVQAAKALAAVVERLPFKQVDGHKELNSTIFALARSCISVYYGLDRMTSLPDHENQSCHVVYACVAFFDSLFTSVEEVASLQAKEERRNKNNHESTIQLFSQLAASLVTNLRGSASNCPAHANILEGAIYHLLHRLGEGAHDLFLDGPRHECIEDEINNLPLPDDKRLDPVRQTALRAVLISAPYLLDVLRRTLDGLPNMQLAGRARLKLQRTLVDCIFGPGTRGPGASEDVLKLPELLGAPPVTQDNFQGDVQSKTDLFESELWTLIGWDILGSEENL